MATTMKIPGIGPVPSKYVYIGGAVIAGIAAYSYYRASQAPADEPVVDGTEAATDGTELAYGDAYGTDYAPDGSGYGYGGGYAPPYYTPSNPDLARDPVTDNEWASESIEWLTDVGVDRQAASLAVSRYRLSDCLTAAQMDIVRQAVGRFGPPPQSRNLQMRSCPAGTTPPPPPASGTKPGAPGSIRVVRSTRNSITVNWPTVRGATGYTMWRNGARVSTVVYAGDHTFTGLKPNTSYTLAVSTLNGTSAKRSVKGKTKR